MILDRHYDSRPTPVLTPDRRATSVDSEILSSRSRHGVIDSVRLRVRAVPHPGGTRVLTTVLLLDGRCAAATSMHPNVGRPDATSSLCPNMVLLAVEMLVTSIAT